MPDDIRLLIADDHPIFRRGLLDVLAAEPGIRVIAEVVDGVAALGAIRRDQPDVALLDIQMPGLTGFQIAQEVTQEGLRTSLVFLTMYDEPAMLERALSVGVAGYVLKDAALSEIVQAVRTVVAGRTFVSPSLSDYLVRRAFPAREVTGKPGSPLDALTERERLILRLIAESRTSKDIAGVLGIHYRTVENHRTAISQKLGLQGSHALVKFAFACKADLPDPSGV
jgi:DNA-binding NarL/FixJ family response regulator